MDAEFSEDWEKLGRLAFRRQEKVGRLFKRVHRLLKARRSHPGCRWLLLIKEWLLVPFTLWPVDFNGLGRHLCQRVQSGLGFDPGVVFLLEQLEHLPGDKARAAVAEYEMLVQQGSYEPLICAREKYASQERELLGNRRLRAEWNKLKRLFPVQKLRDRKGIVRRRMAQERNFRPDWAFRWDTKKARFQAAFDAFCHRWNLYGMEGDKPLLLKLSVNPTAHGLMIVIPTYWSLDSKRDLDWREINKLHKARGALRQGPKMSEGRVQRHQQAQNASDAAKQARKLKLRGQARLDYIARKIPLPLGAEPRVIRRLVSEGASL